MESTERVWRVRLSVMLVIGVAAVAAGLLALMWWKAEPAGAVTDPGRIAFISDKDGDNDIYTMNPDGSGLTHLDRAQHQFYPEISPDGNKIAYYGYNPHTGHYGIHVMNSDGTGQDVTVINSSVVGFFQSPTWSPDGTELAVWGYRYDRGPQGNNSTYDIFRVKADGTGQPSYVTNTNNVYEYYPTWSSNGKIAFTSHYPPGSAEYQSNSTNDIWAVNAADGTGRTNLTNTSNSYEYFPSYSPDGSRIAYSGVGPATNWSYEIFKMNSDGTNQEQLTSTSGYEFQPSWSPDGTQLAFMGYRFAQTHYTYDVFKMNASGTDQTDLTAGFKYTYNSSSYSQEQWAKWGPSPTSQTPVDLTAPVTTASRSVEPNAAGWNKESVTITLSAQDEQDGSGVKHISFNATGAHQESGTVAGNSAQIQVAEEGVTEITYLASDNSDNLEEPKSITVKVDKTAPGVQCGQADTLWHKEDVSISCSATDTTSGLANEANDATFSLSTSVASGTETSTAQTGSRQVFDVAGNSATAGPIGPIKVDKKAPEITLTTPPNNGAEYKLKQQVAAGYSCTDGGSDVGSCSGNVASGSNIDTATVGQKSFTVNAQDKAGNTSSLSHNYSVIYDWTGFFSPVNNPDVFNLVKAGSAIPVKFSLAGNQGLDIFYEEANGSTYPRSAQMPCDSTDPVDAIEQTVTANASGLTYDATADRYSYVWKTNSGWAGTCRQLVVKLDDGEVYRANFKFK